MKKNKHIGSSIDDLMKEEGWYEEAEEQAIKEVIAWQLSQAMEKKRISKSTMATGLKISRTQVNRILNAKSDVTLSSL
jgi:antitoxin HicB